MQLNEKLEALTDSLKEYVDTNYELIKLEVIDYSSEVISEIISKLIVGIMLVLFAIFGGFYLSYYLSDVIGIDYIGFAIVSGFYLIAAIFVHLTKKSLIETKICDSFIKQKLAKKSD